MMTFLKFAAEHPVLIAFFVFVIYCFVDLIVSQVARMYGLHVICKLSDKEERERALSEWLEKTKRKKPIHIELTKKGR